MTILQQMAAFEKHMDSKIATIMKEEQSLVIKNTIELMEEDKTGIAYPYGVASSPDEPMGVKSGDTIASLHGSHTPKSYTVGGNTYQFKRYELQEDGNNRMAMGVAFNTSVERTEKKLAALGDYKEW